jgi:hypothetical protein
MSLIEEYFGDAVLTHLRAAVDPSSGQPTVLIIDIDRPIDDDDSWLRLIEVQQRLIERRDDLAGRLKLSSPYRNVVLNLSGEQSSWSDLLAELERGE